MKSMTKLARAFTGSIGVLLAAITAQADTIYHVEVDTSSLIGNPSSPFYLDFQFIDGSGAANNTATVGNFNFGGGSAGVIIDTFGGASGSLASTITLTDTFFFNELYQSFNPGLIFSFDVSLTEAIDNPAPDAFSFAILDGNLMSIPTSGFANALFFAEIGGTTASGVLQVPDSGAALGGLVLLGICGMDYLGRRQRQAS